MEKRFSGLCRFFRMILKADLPSDMHKEASLEFERYLRNRDFYLGTVGIVYEIIIHILGTDYVTLTTEYMDSQEAELQISDSLRDALPVIRWLHRIVLFSGLLLTLVSLKWINFS